MGKNKKNIKIIVVFLLCAAQGFAQGQKFYLGRNSATSGYKSSDSLNLVKDFGADSTGVLDATTAIQNAMNYMAAHRGAVCFVPKGTYNIAGALKTTDGQGHPVDSAQIYVPYIAYTNMHNHASIKFVGEVAPSPWNDWVDGEQSPRTGVIFKSTSTSLNGSVIGAAYGANMWGNWTFHELFLENICVMVRSKTAAGVDTAATMTALNLDKVSLVDLRDCRIVTESYQGSSVTPAANTYGIKGPNNNNFNNTQYTNVIIQGFYTGLRASEHVDAKNISISTCWNGVEFIAAFHRLDFYKLKIWWCVVNLRFNGPVNGTIHALDIEDFTITAGSKWFNNVWDIYEASNTSSNMDISYHRVVATVGVNQVLNKNIISNIRPVPVAGGVYRMPSVPATATSTGKAGAIAFDANYVYYCVSDNQWVRAPLATW